MQGEDWCAPGRPAISQAARLLRSQSDLLMYLVSVAAGAGVPAVRAGDATHGILRRRGRDCAEAEEGSERKCEREFHDPTPLVQGIDSGNGHAALRDKFSSRASACLIARNSKAE
jgi:hypothetical protein